VLVGAVKARWGRRTGSQTRRRGEVLFPAESRGHVGEDLSLFFLSDGVCHRKEIPSRSFRRSTSRVLRAQAHCVVVLEDSSLSHLVIFLSCTLIC
jgi:hypothetical protein